MLRRFLPGVIALFVAVSCDAPIEPTPELSRVPAATPTSSTTIVIGLVGTMSGPDAWRGDDAFEGADLGVHVLNRALKEGARPFELVTLDDEGDAALATSLVAQLAADPRTAGVVYAGPPEGLPPAAGALDEAGIPAILCYGDLSSAGVLRATLFQMSPPTLWQARAIAGYLVRDRGYSRVGIVTGDSLSGRTAERAAKVALRELGARSVTFSMASDDAIPAALQVMKEKGIQALIVDADPPTWRELLVEIDRLGASYQGTAKARRNTRSKAWHPQLAGFDLTVTPLPPEEVPAPGTIAADTYARGAHYLPVPEFESFHSDFTDWWGSSPQGWELRSYDAVRAIGWAWGHSLSGAPGVNAALETMSGSRFGGLEAFFSPNDHVFPDVDSIGLWVVPEAGSAPESATLGPSIPWVPLARAWTTEGGRTTIPAQDWRYLFSGAPGPNSQAPRFSRSLFGVTTPHGDPLH